MTPRATLAIADYGMLSDCQGSALVARDGSIDWACLPRHDSPAVFARLLDPAGGHWRIGPADGFTAGRSYLEGTLVLRTELADQFGRATLTDALALGRRERGHDIGGAADHTLLRVVEGISGEVDIDVELAPRPEFGRTSPALVRHGSGWRTKGGPDTWVVSSPVPFEIGSDGAARARVRIRQGERLGFALAVASAWEPPPAPLSSRQVRRRLADTVRGWKSWSGAHPQEEGPLADLVARSGLVLRGLLYAPSGAIVAAPTTSLPEVLGGDRNWDYRFCWVRDASMTLQALATSTCRVEAAGLFEFFATASAGLAGDTRRLQILYGLSGERFVPEVELEHLSGYADSRPVRVGNGAWDQDQLDVYGELLDAAWVARSVGVRFDAASGAFLAEVADRAAQRWQEADQGIWEVRGPARHYLHSKLMCWVALDRAIAMAAVLGAEARVAGWEAERQRLRAAIEEQAWDRDQGTFTQAFGVPCLDAATLMLPLVGFLPADDPRVAATVEAVAARLTDERGLLHRYEGDDGLAGQEGSFVLCSYWLVECLALVGQHDRARELFERVNGCANDLGLLAEEVDPRSGALLGNFPQALSHIGQVNAARALIRSGAQGATL